MTDERPTPLVPHEVDLRDFSYMPLYGDRLFRSDTWTICDDAEKAVALRLWWASWHQEPAGSLPNNDRVLCQMAGKGDVIKAFRAVKVNAMLGWIECSDGRLYHPVVAQIAMEVWKTKRKKTADNAHDRERKARKRREAAGRVAAAGGSSGGNGGGGARKTTDLPPEEAAVSGGQADAAPRTGVEGPVEYALKGKGIDEGEVGEESEMRASAQGGFPSLALCASAVDAWNELAEALKLAKVQRLTETRLRSLKLRLGECGGLVGWMAVLAKIRSTPFLLGGSASGWKVDFDFLMRPTRFTKLLEGGYDHVNGGNYEAELTGFAGALAELHRGDDR